MVILLSPFQLSGSISAAIKFKSGKHISPIVFYGSPHGAPVKKPTQLLRLLHEIRVDLREQNKLIPRYQVELRRHKTLWACNFPY